MTEMSDRSFLLPLVLALSIYSVSLGYAPSSKRPMEPSLKIPFLGHPKYLFSILTNTFTQTLQKDLEALPPDEKLLKIQVGPITQLWIKDIDFSMRLFKTNACSSRSQVETSFGPNFLFLVRDPEAAETIREKQKKIISNISDVRAVRNVIIEKGLADVVDMNASGKKTIITRVPVERFSIVILDCLVSLFLNVEDTKSVLDEDELDTLLAALANYRKRGFGVAKRMKQIAVQLLNQEQSKKVDDAEVIYSLLLKAVDRAQIKYERREELLPLLISSVVGGGEIFPLLLHWMILRLSVDPETQENLYDRLDNGGRRSASLHPIFGKTASAIMYDIPYSPAIGPPRKMNQDIDNFEGYSIPEGALIFAVHPNLLYAPHRFDRRHAEWLIDNTPPAGSQYPIFGAGRRSCIASELSLNFLSVMMAEIVRRWQFEPLIKPVGNGYDDTALEENIFDFKEDGSLLVPKYDTAVKFRRRSSIVTY